MDEKLSSDLFLKASELLREVYEAGFRDGLAKASETARSDGARPLICGVCKTRGAMPHGSVAPAVFECVSSNPGVTARDIVAKTGMKRVSVRGALIRMVSDGFLVIQDGRYQAAGSHDEIDNLGRKATISESVLAFLRRVPGSETSVIANRIGRKESSVRVTLHRLKDRGVVDATSGRWSIKQADR